MITLVLLPGMDGTGRLFDPFLQALGAGSDAIVIRYPTRAALGYAELELLVRDSLPSKRPFVVLAESFSGPIALSIAATGLANMRGLILCCSFARNPRPVLGRLRFLTSLISVSKLPTALLATLLLGPFSTEGVRDALALSLRDVDPAVLRRRLDAVLSIDVSSILESIDMPLLYLRALRDRIVPATAAHRIVRGCPSARVVDVEAPHFLLQAAPVAAAHIVRKFIDDIAADPLATR